MSSESKIVTIITIMVGVILLNVNQVLFVAGLGKLANVAVPASLLVKFADLIPVWTDGLVWCSSVLLTGLVLRLWVPRHAHLILLGLLLAYLSAGVGLAEALVTPLWFVSAWAIGAVLLRWSSSSANSAKINLGAAAVIGASVWLVVWGVLMHFPINSGALYLGLCLLALLCIPSLVNSSGPDLQAGVLGIKAWIGAIPFWAWSLGLAAIGWTLRWSSFPSVMFDDHASHLRLWTELLTERRAMFDVHAQIWSVAPFASDLLHAGLSLMAGADARGSMNLGLALLLLSLMARILNRLAVPVWAQWLSLVMMASTPMFGNLLLSLQAELMLGVVALAGLSLIIDADDGWRGQSVLGVLACAALCAAIKLPGVVLGVTLLVSLFVRWWALRGRAPAPNESLRWAAVILLIPFIFLALHAYLVAWRTTGNPVFPLYNAIFQSPFYPLENFRDMRYVHGFSITSYLRVFFHTSEFMESGNHTAGWQYLVLLPVSVFLVFSRSVEKRFRLLLIPLLGFGLPMFLSTQYWRYMFPVMPIAGLIVAALFFSFNRTFRPAIIVLALACTVLNFALFPRSTWLMQSGAQIAYSKAGKEQITRTYAPVVLLTQAINRLAPGSRVLYPYDLPYGATLYGSPLYVNWYAPSRSPEYLSMSSAERMAKFLAEEKVDLAIFSLGDDPTLGTFNAFLRAHLAKYSSPITQEGAYILYRLGDTPALYRSVFTLHAAKTDQPGGARPVLPVIDGGVAVTEEPKVLVNLPTDRAKQARYTVRFRCPSEVGFFIAQINWNKGAPYYRLVACKPQTVSFKEAVPIPIGASQADIYVTTRGVPSARVEDLEVELQ